MASTETSNVIEADTIYHHHENILDLIPIVQNQEFSISLQPAKSLKSFYLFRHGCDEKYISFVIMGTLKALEYIHKRASLVHGNINLSNVFLDKDCKVKLELPRRKNCVIEEQRTDIRMVGELALDLFDGKYVKKFNVVCFSGNVKKKELLSGLAVRDFVKFCLNPLRVPTLREVMNHEFFRKFGEFDQYQEELKKLFQKKLCKI